MKTVFMILLHMGISVGEVGPLDMTVDECMAEFHRLIEGAKTADIGGVIYPAEEISAICVELNVTPEPDTNGVVDPT